MAWLAGPSATALYNDVIYRFHHKHQPQKPNMTLLWPLSCKYNDCSVWMITLCVYVQQFGGVGLCMYNVYMMPYQ